MTTEAPQLKARKPKQGEMIKCAYCPTMFATKQIGDDYQRFCKAKCRVAYSRDVGLQAEAVSVRPLKSANNSIVLHSPDHRMLGLRPGDRFLLVKLPD